MAAFAVMVGCGAEDRPYVHRSSQQISEAKAAEHRVRSAFFRLTELGNSHMGVLVEYDAVPTAYGWRDGQIVLTTSLVDLLNDDQIVAVIAHEAGHLVMEDKIRLPGIGATGYSVTGEFLADQIGCDILIKSGFPPDTMVSALNRIADTKYGQTHERIAQRVAMLRDAYHIP